MLPSLLAYDGVTDVVNTFSQTDIQTPETNSVDSTMTDAVSNQVTP